MPSTVAPVLLDQRLAIDPCSPSPTHLAAIGVTSLEPRTLHQPEKLQNVSKNDYPFTPFIFQVNRFPELLSRHFSIECRPFTGGCRKSCAVITRQRVNRQPSCLFWRLIRIDHSSDSRTHAGFALCKTSGQSHKFRPFRVLWSRLRELDRRSDDPPQRQGRTRPGQLNLTTEAIRYS